MGFRFVDVIDARSAWALLQAAPQAGQLLGRALSKDFDRAIGVVSHPASYAEHVSFTFHKPAKADSLHTPADKKAASVHGFFSAGHRVYASVRDVPS